MPYKDRPLTDEEIRVLSEYLQEKVMTGFDNKTIVSAANVLMKAYGVDKLMKVKFVKDVYERKTLFASLLTKYMKDINDANFVHEIQLKSIGKETLKNIIEETVNNRLNELVKELPGIIYQQTTAALYDFNARVISMQVTRKHFAKKHAAYIQRLIDLIQNNKGS
jgi:hypothetical protein